MMHEPWPRSPDWHAPDCDCPTCLPAGPAADRDALDLDVVCLLTLAGIAIGTALGWVLDHLGAAAPLIRWTGL